MTKTMRGVVLEAPGPPEALTIRDISMPKPVAGWVLIKVNAFGLNRSELHTRLGLGEGVTFPRVLGIEATGVVAACPGGEFEPGQKVMAMMGGMGRTFDGGYAEYTSVPVGQVLAFDSDLDWATLGAVPEMLQTAYGSLTIGLDAQPGQTILIRGGTSSIGMATAVLAKQWDMTVLSTTRKPAKADALEAIGVDHVLVDDGNVATQVRTIVPEGVDAALELIGTPTLPDTLASTRVHGVVCFTGMLSNEWIVKDFYPIDYIPRGVRLTAYGGGATDLPVGVLQDFLDKVAAGDVTLPIHHVYGLDDIVQAHRDMEAGTAPANSSSPPNPPTRWLELTDERPIASSHGPAWVGLAAYRHRSTSDLRRTLLRLRRYSDCRPGLRRPINRRSGYGPVGLLTRVVGVDPVHLGLQPSPTSQCE